MLKNCSFSAHYYKVYGCFGVDGEKYLGTSERLCDALEMCRSHVSDYDVFSLYAKITDVLGSDVFLGCLCSNDLKF